MAYHSRTSFPNSHNQLRKDLVMRDQTYDFNQSAHPPIMSLTGHDLSMLPGPFCGQVPPRYHATKNPFMADSFEYHYETHNPGSQVHTPTPLPKKGSTKKTLAHRSKKQTNPRPNSSLLICQWSKCNKPFCRKATLVRHVVTQHVDPGSVPCLDEECVKVFNQKDNMMSHFRTVHVHGDDS